MSSNQDDIAIASVVTMRVIFNSAIDTILMGYIHTHVEDNTFPQITILLAHTPSLVPRPSQGFQCCIRKV